MKRKIFKTGKKYKVKLSFAKYGVDFFAGEVLIFVSDGYSHYDNGFGYLFRDGGGAEKTWWLHQDEPAGTWKKYFKAVGIFG